MGIKNILITGCGGMLGSSVYPVLKEKGYNLLATDIDLNEEWLSHLDVRNMKEVNEVIKKFNPDLIIHLAALTSLEYCEENPEEAYKTNYIGTRNMALICKELDIPLIYVTTVGVFDGKKYAYTEKDLPNPINVYGKTKLYGEIAVEHLLKKYFIARAGWMMGGGKKDKKFVSYIYSQVKTGNKVFNIVNDKFGIPTYTEDFARNIEILINTEFYGKYNLGCLGEASRAEIAKFIIDTLNVKDAIVNEVSSEFFQKDFPVKRITSERMINSKIDSTGANFIMRDWKVCLKEYLENMEKEFQK